MYLDELENGAIYERTKSYSLSHIVKFANTYEDYQDGMTLPEVLGQPIDDLSDQDFELISSLKELVDICDERDVKDIQTAINKIDEYHKNKKQYES